MASISFASILALFSGSVFSRRNDEKFWSGWIEGDGAHRKVKVAAVSLEESGLTLTLKDGEKAIELAAIPTDLSHSEVSVNGTVDEEASLIFALKPTLFDQTRFAFDFRPVTLDGKELRFNMRYDP